MTAITYSRRDFMATGVASSALLTSAGISAEPSDLTALTIQQASELVRTKSISPVELTQACLKRIERLNPKLNAYITIAAEQALARARQAEAEPWSGPLHGIPIGLKDSIDTAAIRTTGASKVLEHRVPTADAEVVRRLKRAGAVILGKQNLAEFGCSGTGLVSHFGAVHNPWKIDHIAGGSSSGSGAAVAAGFDFGSVGTDAGGSIRIPAAWCGVVGLKPTLGRVSLRGTLSCPWSTTSLGPICRTATDAALLLQVLAGYDPADPSSLDEPVPDYAQALKADPKGLRIGVPRALFAKQVDPEYGAAVTEALGVLGGRTAGVRDVELSGMPTSTWRTTFAEFYGEHVPHITKAPELYQRQTRQRIEEAGRVTVAAYSRDLREIARLRRTVTGVFSKIDLLVLPTMLGPPLSIEETMKKGQPTLDLVMLFNIYDLPALTLPCGFTKAGLPIGLQIIGPRLREPQVLTLARAYEQATDWHKRRPPLS